MPFTPTDIEGMDAETSQTANEKEDGAGSVKRNTELELQQLDFPQNGELINEHSEDESEDSLQKRLQTKELETAFSTAEQQLKQQHFIDRDDEVDDDELGDLQLQNTLRNEQASIVEEIVAWGKTISPRLKRLGIIGNEGDLPWYIISPDSTIKGMWDILLLAIIFFFVLLFLPFRMAFYDAFGDSDKDFFEIDIVIDCMFVLDIILTFFVAYEDLNCVVIKDMKSIAINYVTSWIFPIDVISAFPFYFLQSGNLSNMLKGGKIMRLLKAMRLLKCTKNADYLKNQHYQWFVFGYMKYINTLAVLIFCVLVAVHILACFNFALGKWHYDHGDDTWLEQVSDLALPWRREDLLGWYITCVYFQFTSLSTVGYGDFHPANVSERALCFLSLISGTIIFACMTGLLTTYMVEKLGNQSKVFQNMMNLHKFLGHHDIPKFLARPVSIAMEKQWKMNTELRKSDFDELYDEIPKRIMSAMTFHIMAPLLGKNYEVSLVLDAMQKHSDDTESEDGYETKFVGFEFTRDLSYRFRESNYHSGQHVVTEEEPANRIGIIKSGYLQAVLLNHPDHILFKVGPYEFFGHEPAFLETHERFLWTYISMERTEVYEMTMKDLKDMFDEFPDFESSLKENAKKRLKLFQEGVSELERRTQADVFQAANFTKYKDINIVDRRFSEGPETKKHAGGGSKTDQNMHEMLQNLMKELAEIKKHVTLVDRRIPEETFGTKRTDEIVSNIPDDAESEALSPLIRQNVVLSQESEG